MSKLSRFNHKNYNESSDIGYFLEVDVDYPKKLFNLYKCLPFLPFMDLWLSFVSITINF